MLPSTRYVSGFAGPSSAAPSSSFARAAIAVTLIAVNGAGGRVVANSSATPIDAISKAPKGGSTIAIVNDSTASARTY